jgi:hypothetical protein
MPRSQIQGPPPLLGLGDGDGVGAADVVGVGRAVGVTVGLGAGDGARPEADDPPVLAVVRGSVLRGTRLRCRECPADPCWLAELPGPADCELAAGVFAADTGGAARCGTTATTTATATTARTVAAVTAA